MNSRHILRDFYYQKSFIRLSRTVEIKTRTVKDRITAKERLFITNNDKKSVAVMAIGDKGTGVGSTVKGYDRRGGTWHQQKHDRHAITITTSEHNTSQLCIYCFHQIVHPNAGSSRCLNPLCPAVRCGRATNNRDVMSAAEIGLSCVTKLLLKRDFSPFCARLL